MSYSLSLPFPRSYWALPGRLLAGGYPGDRTPAVAARNLSGLVQCGVSQVLNLMEPDERDHDGDPFSPYQPTLRAMGRAAGRRIRCRRHPIHDVSVPTVTVMRQILDSIDAALQDHRIVYVHCWGGRGRTGTVVGCHLVRHGIAREGEVCEMLAQLTEHERAVFGSLPETGEQREFVNSWRFGQ